MTSSQPLKSLSTVNGYSQNKSGEVIDITNIPGKSEIEADPTTYIQYAFSCIEKIRSDEIKWFREYLPSRFDQLSNDISKLNARVDIVSDNITKMNNDMNSRLDDITESQKRGQADIIVLGENIE